MSEFDSSIEPLVRLFRIWLKFLLWGFRIAPVCLVFALPVVVFFDSIRPWPDADAALAQQYPGQTRMCIGLGSHSERTAETSYSVVSRTYILVPRVFASPALFNATSINHAAPVIEEDRSGFWIFVAAYLGMAIIAVWQWRPVLSRFLKRSAGR